MANTAFTDPDHLTRILRRGLAHIQRHPELIDGCLTETGLALNPGTRSKSAKVSSRMSYRSRTVPARSSPLGRMSGGCAEATASPPHCSRGGWTVRWNRHTCRNWVARSTEC